MILKDKNDYYLCDDDNLFHLECFYIYNGYYSKTIYNPCGETIDLQDYYNELLDYELGTYEYLFYDVQFFEHNTHYKRNGTSITPTKEFLINFKAWARDIKINNIIYDI